MPEVRCRVIGVWWELLALICKSAAESGAARFVVQIVCWKRKKKTQRNYFVRKKKKKIFSKIFRILPSWYPLPSSRTSKSSEPILEKSV